MTSLDLPTTGSADIRAMAGIESRRLARHPAFVIGVVLAFGVLGLMFGLNDDPAVGDLLSMPVVPAFFIGLTSLIATARLTRSTESAEEAVGTAPGSQARRTTALALACWVPCAAGAAWTVVLLALAAVQDTAAQEWWFATLPDWQVWSILLALGPVACLGGGLLGVLVGRWLRFPGAPAVVVVGLVAIDLVGQGWIAETGSSELRLWVPWAMFHSGTMEDGTADLAAGNAAFYLGYLLCLCAAAWLVAVWRDKTARTARLRNAIIGVTVAGLACLALAMTTGPDHNQTSDPVPWKVDDGS